MRPLRSALVLVAPLAIACGSGSGPVIDPNPQPPGPSPDPVEIRVGLERDCGEVPLGGDGLAQIHIEAVGDRDVQVGVSVSDPSRLSLPGSDEEGDLGLVVLPGVGQTVPVVCHGKRLGKWTGQLRVTFWATEDRLQTHKVDLSSEVRGPRLHLEQATLDFGDVHFFPGLTPQPTARRTLRVTNTGNELLELGALRIEGESPEFALALKGSTTVQPDPLENSIELEVSTLPDSAGAKEVLVALPSNDPLAPTRWLRVRANAVALAPCELDGVASDIDFGPLTFGTPEVRRLTLRNTGPDTCLVSGIRVTGSSAFLSLAPQSVEIASGAEVELPILALPHDAPDGGAVTGELELLVSNASSPLLKIPLTATLPPSCLAVEPTRHLSMDAVDLCGARSFFTVLNVCEAPQRVFEVHHPSNPFAMIQTPAILPGGAELAPGERYPFGAQVLATEPGSYLDFVGLELNDTTFSVPMSAQVGEAEAWTDTYVTPETELADVLLVIDNGASLENDLESLRTNLRLFGKYMHSVGGRMRVAVTTTGGTSGHGRAALISSNGETVLDPQVDDFEARFGALVDGIGTGASAHDVFTVVKEVLESGDFPLRPRAPLAVIVITDAREQSPMKPSEFLSFLVSQKPRAHFVSFNAIHGTGYLECGAEQDDGRYGALVRWTNGVRDEICHPDWEKTLEPQGTLAFGFRVDVPLSRVPARESDIEVRIDDWLVPRVDGRGATVWIYDYVTNAVMFEPMYVPEPGKTLEISYPLVCGG